MDEEQHPHLQDSNPGAEDVKGYIEKVGDERGQLATTMTDMPHWYIVRQRSPLSWQEFGEFVELVLRHGYRKAYLAFGRSRPALTYLNVDGWRYWPAGAKDEVLESQDTAAIVAATTIINRTPVAMPWRPLTKAELAARTPGQMRFDVG
jgi:hypothetical protein